MQRELEGMSNAFVDDCLAELVEVQFVAGFKFAELVIGIDFYFMPFDGANKKEHKLAFLDFPHFSPSLLLDKDPV